MEGANRRDNGTKDKYRARNPRKEEKARNNQKQEKRKINPQDP